MKSKKITNQSVKFLKNQNKTFTVISKKCNQVKRVLLQVEERPSMEIVINTMAT